MDDAEIILPGSAFEILAAATGKAQLLIADSWTRGPQNQMK